MELSVVWKACCDSLGGSPLLGLIRKTPGKVVTKGRGSSTRWQPMRTEKGGNSRGGRFEQWQRREAKIAQCPPCNHHGWPGTIHPFLFTCLLLVSWVFKNTEFSISWVPQVSGENCQPPTALFLVTLLTSAMPSTLGNTSGNPGHRLQGALVCDAFLPCSGNIPTETRLSPYPRHER